MKPITKHSTHASISDTNGLLSQNRTEYPRKNAEIPAKVE